MERISPHQFMTLGTGVLLGTTFFPIAQVTVAAAGRDAWLSILPAYSLAIVLGLMVLSIMKKYPGNNLLQVSERVFGKWIGKGISLIYTLVSIYFGSLLLAQVGDTFKRSVMPLTSYMVFLLGVIFLVAFLAWSGIEVFGRFTEIVTPMVIFALFLTIILSIPRFEWNEFSPVLAGGLKPILQGSLKIAPFAMEYILFLAGVLTFLPKEESEQTRLKTGLWRAVLLVALVNTLLTLTEILVFGPTEAKRLNYGIISLGKMVEIARTISGIESVFMNFWLGASLIKVGALFYMAMWGLQSVFGVKDELKWYLFLMAVFFGVAALLKGGPELVQEVSIVDSYIILPGTLLWIPFLWGITHWRKGAKTE